MNAKVSGQVKAPSRMGSQSVSSRTHAVVGVAERYEVVSACVQARHGLLENKFGE